MCSDEGRARWCMQQARATARWQMQWERGTVRSACSGQGAWWLRRGHRGRGLGERHTRWCECSCKVHREVVLGDRQ